MRIFSLLFIVVGFFVSSSATAACQCLCSEFKTRGGERKVCSEQPAFDGSCNNWLHDVPGKSPSDCVALGELENNCRGFARDFRNGDQWRETFDGRYHSCRF